MITENMLEKFKQGGKFMRNVFSSQKQYRFVNITGASYDKSIMSIVLETQDEVFGKDKYVINRFIESKNCFMSDAGTIINPI